MLLKSTNNNEYRCSDKDDFRKESLEILRDNIHLKRTIGSRIVCNKLRNLLKYMEGKTILLYLPLESEVNVHSLIKGLRKHMKVYVPFMECVSFKLVKYRLPVLKKKFNIMEPANSFAKAPIVDIAVVPVVGVDGNFRRVGFGKGMYDRFFASLHPKPFTIFVQLVKCFTARKLCEHYDVQADVYITPTDTMIRRGNDVFRVRNNRGGYGYRSRSGWIYNGKKVRYGKL